MKQHEIKVEHKVNTEHFSLLPLSLRWVSCLARHFFFFFLNYSGRGSEVSMLGGRQLAE